MVGIRQGVAASIAAVALVAAACGGGDDSQVGATPTPSAPTSATEPTTAPVAPPSAAAPELVIGRVLPETGSLSASIGGALIAGVELAVADINAQGGNVKLIAGDSATDPDVAPETVNRLLGEGAHVIIGAAASGVSQSIIQTLYDTQIPQCAASNTSPSFSTQANAEYYFRTVTVAVGESQVMANSMASQGATNVAIANRADDYGSSLARLLADDLAELGVASQTVAFDPNAPSFDATVAEIADMGVDTVALIAFEEGITITRRLIEMGVPGRAIHLTAGQFDFGMPERVNPTDPTVVDGLRVQSPSGSEEFNQRVFEKTGGNAIYGGQAYDCAVILALAALTAGGVDGPAIIAAVPDITRNGQKCHSYGECAELLVQGIDIDYDGVSGPLEMDDVGDTTVGRYLLAEVRNGELEVIETLDVTLDQ